MDFSDPRRNLTAVTLLGTAGATYWYRQRLIDRAATANMNPGNAKPLFMAITAGMALLGILSVTPYGRDRLFAARPDRTRHV